MASTLASARCSRRAARGGRRLRGRRAPPRGACRSGTGSSASADPASSRTARARGSARARWPSSVSSRSWVAVSSSAACASCTVAKPWSVATWSACRRASSARSAVRSAASRTRRGAWPGRRPVRRARRRCRATRSGAPRRSASASSAATAATVSSRPLTTCRRPATDAATVACRAGERVELGAGGRPGCRAAGCHLEDGQLRVGEGVDQVGDLGCGLLVACGRRALRRARRAGARRPAAPGRCLEARRCARRPAPRRRPGRPR